MNFSEDSVAAQIREHVQDLRELYRMVDELDDEISAHEDIIKSYMASAKVDEITGTDYKVIWKSFTTSRLDSAALRQVAPALCEKFTKKHNCKRFVVV